MWVIIGIIIKMQSCAHKRAKSAPKIDKTGTPAEVCKSSGENRIKGEFITNYEIAPKSTLNFQNLRSENLILGIIPMGYQNILQYFQKIRLGFQKFLV